LSFQSAVLSGVDHGTNQETARRMKLYFWNHPISHS
jgi:hypothetical protein